MVAVLAAEASIVSIHDSRESHITRIKNSNKAQFPFYPLEKASQNWNLIYSFIWIGVGCWRRSISDAALRTALMICSSARCINCDCRIKCQASDAMQSAKTDKKVKKVQLDVEVSLHKVLFAMHCHPLHIHTHTHKNTFIYIYSNGTLRIPLMHFDGEWMPSNDADQNGFRMRATTATRKPSIKNFEYRMCETSKWICADETRVTESLSKEKIVLLPIPFGNRCNSLSSKGSRCTRKSRATLSIFFFSENFPFEISLMFVWTRRARVSFVVTFSSVCRSYFHYHSVDLSCEWMPKSCVALLPCKHRHIHTYSGRHSASAIFE